METKKKSESKPGPCRRCRRKGDWIRVPCRCQREAGRIRTSLPPPERGRPKSGLQTATVLEVTADHPHLDLGPLAAARGCHRSREDGPPPDLPLPDAARGRRRRHPDLLEGGGRRARRSNLLERGGRRARHPNLLKGGGRRGRRRICSREEKGGPLAAAQERRGLVTSEEDVSCCRSSSGVLHRCISGWCEGGSGGHHPAVEEREEREKRGEETMAWVKNET